MDFRHVKANGRIFRMISIIGTILLILLTASCSYVFNPTIWIGSKTLYEGPNKSSDEIATLIVYRDGTSLISVDGQDVRYAIGRGLKIGILPGQHNLAVSFHISGNVVESNKVTTTTISSKAIYNLTFNAEAGHVYRVSSIVDDRPENREATTANGKTWSAYLYDITEVGYPTRLVEMLSERGKGVLVTKQPN